MSAKGFSFPMFSTTMESNTTAYVLCGLVAIVFLNFLSKYVAKSTDSEKTPSNRREEEKGTTIAEESFDVSARGGFHEDGNKCWKNGITEHSPLAHTTPQDVSAQLTSAIQDCGLDEPKEDIVDQPTRDDGENHVVPLKTAGGDWRGDALHEVHLLENGWTTNELDEHEHPIEFYAWFARRQSCAGTCELLVVLQDEQRRRILEYPYNLDCCKLESGVFKKVSLIFENYGPGIRYVTYCQRRRKPMDSECDRYSGNQMYIGLRKVLKNK